MSNMKQIEISINGEGGTDIFYGEREFPIDLYTDNGNFRWQFKTSELIRLYHLITILLMDNQREMENRGNISYDHRLFNVKYYDKLAKKLETCYDEDFRTPNDLIPIDQVLDFLPKTKKVSDLKYLI